MSENNPSANQRKWWKKKWKMKMKLKASRHNYRSATSARQDNKSHFNVDFTQSRTIKFHPHNSTDNSFKGSSSQSTAAVTQGSTSSATQPICDTAAPTRSPSTITARLGTPAGKAKVSADSSNAVAGPSSRPSSLQKTVSSFSSPRVSSEALSKYLLIDCEMVSAGPKGHMNQLARCSIVSYDGDVVYDKFIHSILMLVKGKVLIGHAIHNDFKVLNYWHAKDLTRDTSCIPLLNVKAGFTEREVVSLKRLTKALFNRVIQTGRKGHSSVEDARATMDLYKLVEAEWDFGSNCRESSVGK